MIIDSTAFATIPGLTLATLTESADDVSVLTLEFAGFGPDWLEYMQPVTIMHRGRVLFHGKITSYSRNNDSGEATSSATVSNLLWLLDHQTLGAQIAEVKAAADNENTGSPYLRSASLQTAANNATASWTALAESCRISAPGWIVNEDGTEAAESLITLDASRARYSFGAYMTRERAITAWTALLDMKTCNPDCTYRVNYTTGAVEVISISKADAVAWDTRQQGLISASDISPQYEDAVTGVAVLVSWSGEHGSGVTVRTYPKGLDLAQLGVKVFTASVENVMQATAQAQHMLEQCQAYYEAANALQWGGSVSAKLADVPASPLCACLNLTGPGTHESWGSMAAIVTEVEWDFMELTCTLTLGRTVDEPDLHELQFEDNDGGDDDSTGDDGGDMEDDSTGDDDIEDDLSTDEGLEEELSTEDGLPTLGDTTTANATGTEESTTEEEASATGSGSGSSSGSGSGGSAPPEGSGSASGSGSGSQQGSQGSGSGQGSAQGSGQGSGSSGGSGSSPSGSGSAPAGCDCASKWDSLDDWKQSIEDRLAALESAAGIGSGSGSGSGDAGGTGSCGCGSELQDIKSRLETVEKRTITFDSQWFSVSGQEVSFNSAGIQTAVNSIITGVTIDVTASGLSETTAFGTISVDTSGGGDLGNASFNSSVHY